MKRIYEALFYAGTYVHVLRDQFLDWVEEKRSNDTQRNL